MKTPLTTIFIGPQGSGKGTQVELLRSALKDVSTAPIVDIQTGRLFRSLAANDSFASQQVAKLITEGTLVPDFFTNSLWITDMADRLTADAHLLIDGFPRTVRQATILAEAFSFFDRAAVQVINLDTPEDVVVARMMERGRSDDTPDAIQHRLAQYRADTMPVLGYYKEQAGVRIHTINGAGTVEEVHEAICGALGCDSYRTK